MVSSESKNRILYIVILLAFLLAVFLFGAIRAGHELRWSAWAFGDAQAIFAAEHFLTEGLFNKYMLPAYGINTDYERILGNVYTHYPQLVNIPFITLLKFTGINDIHLLKAIHVFISMVSLLFWYIFARSVSNERVALLSTVFILFSVVFLDFMDSLVHPYDELLRFGFLAAFVAAHRAGSKKTELRLLLLAWFLALLQSGNSYEYIFFIQFFIFGYYIFIKRRFALKRIVLFATAPLTGLAIHFAQVIALQGFRGFIDDYSKMFFFRTVDNFQLKISEYLATLYEGISLSYGIGMLAFFLCLAAFCLLALYFRKTGALKVESGREVGLPGELKIVLLLFISGITWYIVFMQSTSNFIIYMTRHLFPFLALSIALMTDYTARWALVGQKWHEQGRWMGRFTSGAFLLALIITLWLPYIENSYAYIAAYPNRLGFKVYPLSTHPGLWTRDVEICKTIKAKESADAEGFIINKRVFASYTSPGRFPSVNAVTTYYCDMNIISFTLAEDFPGLINEITDKVTKKSEFFLLLENSDPFAVYLNQKLSEGEEAITKVPVTPGYKVSIFRFPPDIVAGWEEAPWHGASRLEEPVSPEAAPL